MTFIPPRFDFDYLTSFIDGLTLLLMVLEVVLRKLSMVSWALMMACIFYAVR